MLHMREYPDLSLFTSVELNFILENMCVNFVLSSRSVYCYIQLYTLSMNKELL